MKRVYLKNAKEEKEEIKSENMKAEIKQKAGNPRPWRIQGHPPKMR